MPELSTALALGRVIKIEIGGSGLRVRLKRLDRARGVETDWIQVASPMIGPDAGLVFAPEIGDIAVLAFAAKRPIVLGFITGADMAAPSDALEERIIQSRNGNALVLIDGDSGGITLKDEHDNEIVMNKNGITLKSKGEITIEASRTATVKGRTVELNP